MVFATQLLSLPVTFTPWKRGVLDVPGYGASACTIFRCSVPIYRRFPLVFFANSNNWLWLRIVGLKTHRIKFKPKFLVKNVPYVFALRERFLCETGQNGTKRAVGRACTPPRAPRGVRHSYLAYSWTLCCVQRRAAARTSYIGRIFRGESPKWRTQALSNRFCPPFPPLSVKVLVV